MFDVFIVFLRIFAFYKNVGGYDHGTYLKTSKATCAETRHAEELQPFW